MIYIELQKEIKQIDPVLGIFNYPEIQQRPQQRHINRMVAVQKCEQSLKDFLDSVDTIHPAHHKTASEAFHSIIPDTIVRHS